MTQAPTKLTILEHLLHHVGILSPMQRKSFVTSLLMGIAGLIGMGVSPQKENVNPTAPGAQQSGYVDSSSNTTANSSTTSTEDSWSYWASHKGAKLGFGFLGGFSIAFAFRAFIKTMAMITAVVVSVLGALSYFNILNVDLSSVQQAYTTHSDWLIAQATKLKDVAWNHIPSSTAGTLGMFFGITRKR